MNEIAKLEYFLNNPAPYEWRDYYRLGNRPNKSKIMITGRMQIP